MESYHPITRDHHPLLRDLLIDVVSGDRLVGSVSQSYLGRYEVALSRFDLIFNLPSSRHDPTWAPGGPLRSRTSMKEKDPEFLSLYLHLPPPPKSPFSGGAGV